MKILIANQYQRVVGGVERYISDLCRQLKKLDYKIDFLHGEPKAAEEMEGVDRSFSLAEIWRYPFGLAARVRNELGRVLQESHPDLVFIHNLDNPTAIRFLGRASPLLWYVHGFKPSCPDGKRLLRRPTQACHQPVGVGCLLRAHTRRCMPRSPVKAIRSFRRAEMSIREMNSVSRVIVASHFMRGVMKENGIGDLQVSVLPYFAPWKGEHWSDPQNRNGILYVGRVNFGKGIFALIHALSKLEKATLDIVGDGPDREAVEEAIKKMGMERRVACHGWIRDKATLQGFYRRNAVVAVPSLWPEPFGIVGLEAGMCFRPSVAFDVGGISDWLKQERTGYLVEPGNLNALEHSLRSLLDDSDTGREMGREAHGFIGSTFSVETHLEQLQKLFDRVVSAGKP